MPNSKKPAKKKVSAASKLKAKKRASTGKASTASAKKKSATKKKPAKKKAAKKKAAKKKAAKKKAAQKKPVKKKAAKKPTKKKLPRTKAKTIKTKSISKPDPAGYSRTPLVKKLGIKPESTLTLLGEPADFLKILGPDLKNVKIRKTAQGDRDLTIWFPRDLSELTKRIEPIASAVKDGGLWIAWPKQASGVPTDLTQERVRNLGLAEGIVDYKICAIDETFSGLKFATRKK